MLDASSVFPSLPLRLRTELMTAFASVMTNYREHRWEPAELNGGKLCEIVYSILHGHVTGKMPTSAAKPKNMLQACQQLEQADASKFPRSIRIQIPRMLIALYEIRNNRGVGHVGGDVDPNHMDATAVVSMCKWVLAELVRIFHELSLSDAADVVESVVERSLPIVWSTGTKKRVLRSSLSMRDKVLVLLYSTRGKVSEADLFAWVEHSNRSVFRRDVLKKAHVARLIEFDSALASVEISPLGVREVETRVALDI